MKRFAAITISTFFVVTACGDSNHDIKTEYLALDDVSTKAIIEFVNDSSITFELLDKDVALDKRSPETLLTIDMDLINVPEPETTNIFRRSTNSMQSLRWSNRSCQHTQLCDHCFRNIKSNSNTDLYGSPSGDLLLLTKRSGFSRSQI